MPPDRRRDHVGPAPGFEGPERVWRKRAGEVALDRHTAPGYERKQAGGGDGFAAIGGDRSGKPVFICGGLGLFRCCPGFRGVGKKRGIALGGVASSGSPAHQLVARGGWVGPCEVGDFEVGDDGHADPLGVGAGAARAGRITADQLPDFPSGLQVWEGGDFVLANEHVAMVIEDVGQSDLYDPWGGRDDLGQGRVRVVGVPKERIEEDLLRLLRFFRFQAAYGRPPADQEALAACRIMAPRLCELSGERVRDEMFRILLAPNPADSAVLMRGIGAFAAILPEPGDVGRLRMPTCLEGTALKRETAAPDAARRLAALLDPGCGGAGAEAVARRLRLSNREADRLATAAAPVQVSPDGDAPGLRRTLRRLGAETVRDLSLLAWAGELAVTHRLPAERTGAWRHILEAADAWRPLAFPLRGRDVPAFGVAPGPAVGRCLAAVEAVWGEGASGPAPGPLL